MGDDGGFGGDDGGFGREDQSTLGSDENDGRCISPMEEEDSRSDSSSRRKGSDESDSVEELDQPIGLILTATPELFNFIETSLADNNVSAYPSTERSRGESDRLKASNIPMLYLRIGSWQIESRHQGHLAAKCYFSKKKLIWEILEGPLKRKLEISWSDIIGIQIMMADDERDVLDIELNQPPSFGKEQDPQPRKHTVWCETNDFTEGQALIYRRHHLKFPSGTLEKHYNKLLKSDPRICMLSKKAFPTCRSPFFNRNDFESSQFSTNNFEFSQFPVDFGRFPIPMAPRLHHPSLDGLVPHSNGFSISNSGDFQYSRTSQIPQFPVTNTKMFVSGGDFKLKRDGLEVADQCCLQQKFNLSNNLLLNSANIPARNDILPPLPEIYLPEQAHSSCHGKLSSEDFRGISHVLSEDITNQELENGFGITKENILFPSFDTMEIARGRNFEQQVIGSSQGNQWLNVGAHLQDSQHSHHFEVQPSSEAYHPIKRKKLQDC